MRKKKNLHFSRSYRVTGGLRHDVTSCVFSFSPETLAFLEFNSFSNKEMTTKTACLKTSSGAFGDVSAFDVPLLSTRPSLLCLGPSVLISFSPSCPSGSGADAGVVSEGGFAASLPGEASGRAACRPRLPLRHQRGVTVGDVPLLRHAKQQVQGCVLLLLQTGQSNRLLAIFRSNLPVPMQPDVICQHDI